MPSRRAFTIIELILVILIIGAMMSMALFRLDGIFPDTRLRQASARAADMMELASVQGQRRTAREQGSEVVAGKVGVWDVHGKSGW